MVIRRLGGGDAAAYRELRLRLLRDSPTAFTSSFDEERVKPLSVEVDWLAAVGRPNDAVFGAYDGSGALMGIAGLLVAARRQERHKSTLVAMGVAPEARGRGVGKALVARIVEYAGEIGGIVQIGLTVSEGNHSAERLYRSFGFEVWGREHRAVVVAGRPVTKLHMVCLLDAATGAD